MRPLSTPLRGVALAFWDALVSLLSTLCLHLHNHWPQQHLPRDLWPCVHAQPGECLFFHTSRKTNWVFSQLPFLKLCEGEEGIARSWLVCPHCWHLPCNAIYTYSYIHIGFWIRQWPLKTKLQQTGRLHLPTQMLRSLPALGWLQVQVVPSPQKPQMCR